MAIEKKKRRVPSHKDFEWVGEGVQTRRFGKQKPSAKAAAAKDKPKAKVSTSGASKSKATPKAKTGLQKRQDTNKSVMGNMGSFGDRKGASKSSRLDSKGAKVTQTDYNKALAGKLKEKAARDKAAPKTTTSTSSSSLSSGRSKGPGGPTTPRTKAMAQVQADRASGKDSKYYGLSQAQRDLRSARASLLKEGTIGKVVANPPARNQRGQPTRGTGMRKADDL